MQTCKRPLETGEQMQQKEAATATLWHMGYSAVRN